MSKMNQKEAVYSAVMSVLSDNGVQVRPGVAVRKMMTPEFRGIVNAILFQQFKAGKIELETPEIASNDGDLKNYVSGLQSNWLRKDTRLNGGEKYKPTNPGSRTGSGDEQLKALRALLSTRTVASERAEIQAFIDARIASLKAEAAKNKPAKVKPINIAHVPTALHKFLVRA